MAANALPLSTAPITQTFCVSAGSYEIPWTAQASTQSGGNWLTVTPSTPATYTCGPQATPDGSQLAPGTYNGSIVVTMAGQSLTIPVTLVVLPPATPPFIGSVVNSASAIEEPVAPGEIVSIFGVGLAQPETNPAPFEVLFDATVATPLYTSYGQINVVVPHTVSGQTLTNVQVIFEGQSAAWTLPVAGASPAIFTLDSSGLGAGAILNQDNSVNTPGNPAARGSVIQIFGTGVGSLNTAPVSVTIGAASAFVEYAGPAPDAAGLYQINAVVPAGVPSGATVPILFSVGSLSSQSGVTVAVQ